MCLNPITIRNLRKFQGLPTPFGYYFQIPCGKCVDCLENKISMQLGRLLAHAQQFNGYCIFVTLTIDNDKIPVNILYPGVEKSHLAPIIKAINNSNSRKGTNYSYFFTSEYGSETDRPHYHGLLYGFRNLKEAEDFLHKYYKLGFITLSECNGARFNYIANSHISKCSHVPWYLADLESGLMELCNKPFVLCSRGLGYKFVEENKWQIYNSRLLRIDGMNYPLHPSLVSHLASLFHCSVPMLWYKQNLNSLKLEKKSPYDKILEHLGIDASEYDFKDALSLSRLSDYVHSQIDHLKNKFSNKYSTKKTNSNNV